jgi:phospholipase C
MSPSSSERKTSRRRPARTTYVAAAADDTLANLKKIEHVVVLMLENRSFDHMLGYLSLEAGRTDLDGLKPGLSNRHRNNTYRIRHLQRTALTDTEDPPHGGASTAEQIDGNMGGFVASFAKHNPQAPHVGLPMAYYNGSDLPVYDHLAREFCVCDHWFCSVAGETFPNRCYAVAGTSRGRRNNIRGFRRLLSYNVPSFLRHLDEAGVEWRWYSHDAVPTLWMMDPLYGLSAETIPAYFDRRDALGNRSFLERAAADDLPAVSWIDPNFVDFTVGPAGSNDDHPPGDLHAGQKLALDLFHALVRSKAWEKTLAIVVYDEHGGFYDHVPPPKAKDDYPGLRQCGPRVPALLISPWVEPGQVETRTFEHTTIIKTILARFCRDKKTGQIPDMGARVRAAPHLGKTLGGKQARPPLPQSDYQYLIDQARAWSEELAQHEIAVTDEGVLAPEQEFTDFQEDYLAARNSILDARVAQRRAAAETGGG